ncbi:Poly(A)-specific ribonuclease PARN [Smittium culicis]|uniref:Poly(A)-specific ribonuclease PARN n=1 Tax=Smittium culicis TaxID=133412 RepID=A0A1R1X1J6_9FUNG|nr:Poly(A)-specific ribonuclease PARN [Smittium culicis]
MDVTKANFQKVKLDFEKSINDSELISIDLEMTGLWDSFYSKANSIDNMQMKYEKIKNAAEKFQIIQFGVCTFHKKIVQDYYGSASDNSNNSEDSTNGTCHFLY